MAGLWKATRIGGVEGFRVHDFLRYQPSRKQTLENRRKTAERLKRWRAKHHTTEGAK